MSTKRYFIELSYDGTPYHGWQTQPNAISVQACLDKALSIYFRQDIVSLGCGRTDTGVHATQFYAHFDLINFEKDIHNCLSGINALLPYSIAAKQIFEVKSDAHARFDATQRTYHYHLHFKKDPFKINRSWLFKENLDVKAMNDAAKILLDYVDFSCFSKSNTQTFTNNCTIKEAYFTESENELIFTITADRFLRNMVRAIVGTLIQIGKGEINQQNLKQIIESKNRSNAGQSVPACGLYLSSILYPFDKIICQK